MRAERRPMVAILLVLTLALLLPLAPAQAQSGSFAYHLQLQGPITVATQGYVERAISSATAEGAGAILIELNTPGGGLTTTREMVEAMRASTVPIIVYVSPAGATAASAGTILTMAADAAAMAPGTSIGAASPVSMEGEMGEVERRKAENIVIADLRAIAEARTPEAQAWLERAVLESAALTAREALELGVVDTVAESAADVLAQLDGLQVNVAGRQTTLETADLELRELPLSLAENFLHTLLNPNLALILLTVGLNAILLELSSPGGYVAGVIGAIALLLGLFAMGVLDVNWAGVALIILAFVLFFADAMSPSLGALSALGAVSMVLGSLVLFSSSPHQRISLSVVAGVSVFTAGFFGLIVAKAVAAQRRRPATGISSMVGMVGTARTALDPGGMILVDGELWQAKSVSGLIPEGSPVRVTAVTGLSVLVEQA